MLEGSSFPFQAPLQRAFAHFRCTGDFRAPRFASRQAAKDRGADAAACLGMIQPLEMFAGEPLMYLGEKRMRRWQGRHHIIGGEQQSIHRRIEAQGAFESILIWLSIIRRWKPQFECERT